MLSRIGRTSRFVAAAAMSFTLFAGFAAAQDGYFDVRVRGDNVGCGPVVLKWPADQEEREYDPNPAANDPKLEMAETRPLPVIHHHPSLNAGMLYLPPQDGIYRHYFPESEAPPRLRRWNRAEYEEYVRENNPSIEVPFAEGFVNADPGTVPGTVIIPTGMATPPVAFVGSPAGYIPVPGQGLPDVGDVVGTAEFTTGKQETVVPQPEVPAPAPATPVKSVDADEEGTGSFIHLSSIAEKVPFVGPEPSAPVKVEVRKVEDPSVETPFVVEMPAAIKAAAQALGGTVTLVTEKGGAQQKYEAVVLPNDETLKIGTCGAPVCQ